MNAKYSDYLKSAYWQAVSKVVKAKARYRCQVCDSPHDLNAHHRTYAHRGSELDHLDDLVCLCRRCHETFHGKDKVVWVASPTPAEPVKQVAVSAPAPVAAPAPGYVLDVSKLTKKQRRALRRQQRQEMRKVTKPRYEYDHLADMPEGDPITLTLELVNRARTKAFAFTNASLRALGIKAPLLNGWPKRLVGKVVSRETYMEALVGRSRYNTGSLEYDYQLAAEMKAEQEKFNQMHPTVKAAGA